VAALSAALGADPGRGDLWSELATALVAAGRSREAWDAAVRAVELAPQSAASHRAVGTVAAALDDPRQAESAYRHALLLDPADFATQAALSRLPRPATPADGGRRRAPDAALPEARRPADGPTPTPYTDPPTSGGRRRAPDPDPTAYADPPTGGRRRAPDPDPSALALPPYADPPTSGGRRRAPESDYVDPPTGGGRRRAPEADALPSGGRRRAPETDPAHADPPASGGRRRAPEADPAYVKPTSGGRRRAAEEDPPEGGRRRAPDPAANGSRHAAADPAWGAAPAPVTTAVVGLPAWLVSSPPAVQNPEWNPQPAYGATRATGPDGWHRALVAVVRVQWLLALACYVGLAYPRVAPYTAGALAGIVVLAGAYGRVRWQTAHARRPETPDRPATGLALAAAATAVVVIPAAMVGALTVARVAAIAAVTCATAAAVLLRKPV
jgi:hypothetical protein